MFPEILLVLLVGLLLAVLLRAVFGRSEPPRNYGLLTEIATVPSANAAKLVTDRLGEQGVRVTTVPRSDDDGLAVMVFPDDTQRALAILLAEWPEASV
ncbi:MAG: hypothetical protein ACRDRL_22870 [Sciscionella sp.]